MIQQTLGWSTDAVAVRRLVPATLCTCGLGRCCLPTQSKLLRHFRPTLAIGRRDDRVILRELPFIAILLWRQAVRGLQMPLQCLALEAVFQARNVFVLDRLLDRRERTGLFLGGRRFY